MILDDESGWIIAVEKENKLYFVYDFNYNGKPELDENYLMANTFEENKVDKIVDELIKKGYNTKKLWLDIKLKEKQND